MEQWHWSNKGTRIEDQGGNTILQVAMSRPEHKPNLSQTTLIEYAVNAILELAHKYKKNPHWVAMQVKEIGIEKFDGKIHIGPVSR